MEMSLSPRILPSVLAIPLALEAELGPLGAAATLLGLLMGVPIGCWFLARAIGRRSYGGNAILGWMRLAAIPYLRWFQRTSVHGRNFIPVTLGARGLIVVANHAAGLDPVLLQCAMRHPIRFMMSAEMMLPALAWAWRLLRVIPVCFDNRDAFALKGAIAHVADGGTMAIFPEGAIERPARQLRPFSGGLRLILARSKAPVLVAIIDPGDAAKTTWGSLFKATRASVQFVALIEPTAEGHPRETAQRIFELMQQETGWPTNETPPDEVNPELVARNLRAFNGGG